MAQRLLVSFSGGRSSAYMMKRLFDEYDFAYEMLCVFANTGQEDERTLAFVDRCSREWNVPVVWVEALVHHGSKTGTGFKIVTFASASRAGEPFEEVIAKYGIPNMAYPHCTRELKLAPIRAYLKSVGWTDYLSAVGIRADEPKRISDDPKIIYPMYSTFPTTKAQVNDWWSDQPFQLDLLGHEGNCITCHKKSDTKLIRIAVEQPSAFDWADRMEEEYGLAGHNVDGTPRTFYRKHRTAKDFIAMASILQPLKFGAPHEDEDSGCSESCEAFVSAPPTADAEEEK
jgi:hypothetical protein